MSVEKIFARIVVSALFAMGAGALFTFWAKGNWDTPTFVAFTLAFFIYFIIPRPELSSSETTSQGSNQGGQESTKA